MTGRFAGSALLACLTGLIIGGSGNAVQTKPDGASVCKADLGLEHTSDFPFGPDAFASSAGAGAVQGRLQDPSGAWCVARQDVENQTLEVSWWVDLGRPFFVTGHKAQGPPAPLITSQDQEQIIYFHIHTSIDGNEWTLLTTTKEIYSSFKATSPDDVSTVNWNAAALARFVRFTLDPSKCFFDKQACLRFELLGCTPESTQLWTNLRVSSTEDGTATLSWDVPLLWTGEKGATVTPDDYISSYIVMDVENKPTPTVESKTGGKSELVIRNAYLGAVYIFKVKCVFEKAGLAANGGNISLSLYPTCPSNWFPSGSDCLHSQKETLSWPEVLKKCKRILDDPSQASPSDPIPEGTKTWVVYKQTNTDDPQPEGDCSILTMNKTESASQDNPDECPASNTLPYACIFQRQTVFAIPQNFVVNQASDQSAHVTWTDSSDGWKTLSKKVKIDDGEGPTDWVSYPSHGASLSLTKIEVGRRYTVTTAPDVANFEGLQHDTFTIVITSDGVLKNVTISAYVVWMGAIHLEWTEAVISSKDGKNVKAEGYFLTWMPATAAASPAPQPLTTTTYDLQFPTFGTSYTFYLSCKFAEKVIPCGAQSLHINIHRASHDATGSHLLLYTYATEKLAWQEAEMTCSKQGGHLVGVTNEAEDKRVESLTTVFSDPYWLGGTNCNGKITTWQDNTVWKYARAPVRNFRSGTCCLQVAAVGDIVSWQGADCNAKATYVCKFDIPVSVSVVQDLTATVESSTQVQLNWKPPNKNWKPSYYSIESCIGDKCTYMTKVVTTSAALVDGLAPNTDYNLKVTSQVNILGVKNEATVAVKTGSPPPVTYTLNSEGVMKVKWMRKIQQGQDSAPTKVKFTPIGSTAAGGEVDGTASEITVTGLELEKEYSFTVSESSGGDSDTITAVIRPMCPGGQKQYNSMCIWPTPNEGKYSQAYKDCRRSGGRLAKADELKKQLLLGVIAKEKKLTHWIEGQQMPLEAIEVEALKAAPEKFQETDAVKSQDVSAADVPKSAEFSREIIDEGTCQMMKRDTQDIKTGACTQSHPAICEKKVAVTLLSASGFKTSQVTQTSATITWDAPQSWKPAGYKISLKQEGSRRKRALPNNVEVKDNKFTTSELLPGTSYVFEALPLIKQEDGTTIEGKAETVKFATQKIVKPEPTVTAPQAVQAPVEPEPKIVVNNCTYPASLHTFHIIGCATLVTLVSLSLLIFVFCRMHTFRDSLAQINMEFTLLIVHILILINATSPGEMDFRSASISIHFFFMVSFAFLALECVCIAKAMTRVIPLYAFTKQWQLMVVGWGIPLICIAFSAGILFDDYPSNPSCWVNTSTDVLYSTSIPIGFFCAVALLLLIAAFCLRPTENYEVDEESFLRERVLENTRWVMMLLLILMTVAWACGMVGADSNDESVFLVFIIFNILIGVCFLILRCFGDAEIRTRIRQCCSGGKVSPEEEDPQIFVPSKDYPEKRFNNFTPPQTAGGYLDKKRMMINRAYVFQP